jgi:hypothetical protein
LILFDLIHILIGWKNGRLHCANGPKLAGLF